MSRRGFTLVEALAALAMIAIVLPVAMQGMSVGIGLGSEAKSRAEAAELAAGKLDELTATGSWRTGELHGEFGGDFGGSGGDHQNYRWQADLTGWQDTTVQQLSVTVTWTSRQKQRDLTLTTLVEAATP